MFIWTADRLLKKAVENWKLSYAWWLWFCRLRITVELPLASIFADPPIMTRSVLCSSAVELRNFYVYSQAITIYELLALRVPCYRPRNKRSCLRKLPGRGSISALVPDCRLRSGTFALTVTSFLTALLEDQLESFVVWAVKLQVKFVSTIAIDFCWSEQQKNSFSETNMNVDIAHSFAVVDRFLV